MTQRLLADDVTRLPLDHEPLPGDEVEDGSPTAAVRTLDTLGGVEVGVWEMTVGTARDTEVDEVFVVVAGSGTVEFEDGERLRLGPGTVVRLRAGDRTRWLVDEPLRKVWVA
ncbi:cupin domain-containing protein [Phycicoccus sonneratiae]|uniref:Cupin domain-containing protein n=1 Tax=Phycicoccus sonneratiae TaxID=2807628 RepID=A0ABS2CG64_9MICO|nr:cupin domain-containing protein [Phycicoccus sonneraticus]MBM6398856.1 cupin domain-containing protein [Phycicoccus sonneraticus]